VIVIHSFRNGLIEIQETRDLVATLIVYRATILSMVSSRCGIAVIGIVSIPIRPQLAAKLSINKQFV